MPKEPTHSIPVVLRTVRREPVTVPTDKQKTGLEIVCPPETTCPHCHKAVPLAGAAPLSTLPCPSCGNKVFASGRLGWFLLHGHIGEGEMGTVYRATDESLDREVAIKLVRGREAQDPASFERLRREACAAGKLNHPRVAQVYALIFSNGQPYLVMELVTGLDFAQKLEAEGRIDERTALTMALDVADGLSALRRQGLVHGDIKPANIVLDREGHAKLVDFGLSGMKRFDSKGHLIGTPNYIAPELLRGAEDSHRSDIYSLGATLYHLLVGRPPTEGEKTIDVLKARLLGNPILLYKVGGHLSAPTKSLLMRMLETAPEKRPADSDEVAAAIREALLQLDTSPPVKRPVSESLRNFFENLQKAPPPAPVPRRASIIVIFGPAIVALELLIAIPTRSFPQVWHLLSHRPVNTASQPTRPQPASQPKTASDSSAARQLFTLGGSREWQSMNLGGNSQRGSTMRMGGTLIIQGPGADGSRGDDNCRFVWTKASKDYSFSAQVKSGADNGSCAVTGLLIKGVDPKGGPALLFGLLGSGELFLQLRQPDSKPVILKRSEHPLSRPSHLKITRSGNVFETFLSLDGRTWALFANCELALPAENAIGFSVSAPDSAALATGTFADIRVL